MLTYAAAESQEIWVTLMSHLRTLLKPAKAKAMEAVSLAAVPMSR